MADDTAEKEAGGGALLSSRRPVRTSANSYAVQRRAKLELKEKIKRVSNILKKSEHERTAAEKALVKKNPDIVKTSQRNAKRLEATKSRTLEIEDEPKILDEKCDQLADLLDDAERVVVYTGAGISTAASIPDYRGPNGVWTLLKKGQEPCAHDLSDAEPTFTHMSITKLFRAGLVKHVVSQNCDGLHIRSGYPRYALSEVHGNMYIECCYACNPHKEYIRLFDVTERTGVRRHTTARRCRTCGSLLTDTIVHFGEKGKIKSPYRWKEAVRAAKNSDLILCLGSSLKILRRYTCLWSMDKKPHQRPKLVIVNLQWTPKDDLATLKINGRCDYVMERVMNKLEFEVPEYKRETDPIFKFCTPLRASELKTTSKKILIPPFLPAKTPSKTSKKSRPKKSQAYKKGRKTTRKPSASVSQSDNKEESPVKDESSQSKNEIPFSALFGKSEIKADWDTPIFALEPPDLSPSKMVKKEPVKNIDSKPCVANPETISSDGKPTDLISTEHTEKDFVTDPLPHEKQSISMDNKIDAGDIHMNECKAFDSEIKKEHRDDDFNDICRLKLDIESSLCQVQSAKVENEVIDKSSNAMALGQKDQMSECVDENLQVTQPVPGTFVIDLQIVDEDIDNFSFDQSDSPQIGICQSNVLLINLNSYESEEISVTKGNSNVQSYTRENNICNMKSHMSVLKEPQRTNNVSVLQQRDFLKSTICSSINMPWKNKNDLLTPTVKTLSKPSDTISQTFPPQPFAQSSHPSLSVKDGSENETNSSLSVEEMSVKPPSWQQSDHILPLPPLMSHLTSFPNHQPHATSSSSSSNTALFNWSRKSPVNPISNGMQRDSDLLPLLNSHQIFLSNKIHENKQIFLPKGKRMTDNHEKLRQLLNTPVSVDNDNQNTGSSHIGKAAMKKLMSSPSQNENVSSQLDHGYSQIVIPKEYTKSQENIHPSAILQPQGKSVEQNGNKNVTKSRVQFCPRYEINNLLPLVDHVKGDPGVLEATPSVQDDMKAICPSTLTKSGQGISPANTTYKMKDTCDGQGSIPRCVLNMDDILKPGLREDLSNRVDPKEIETFNKVPQKSVQDKTKTRSSSPFQAVSLISSLSSSCHGISSQNTMDDGSRVSYIISKTSLSGDTTLTLDDTYSDDNRPLDEVTILDASPTIGTGTEPLPKDSSDSHLKGPTKMCVDINNEVRSPKRHINALPQPMKCSSAQNTKNNAKKGCKRKKRTINVGADRAEGWKSNKLTSSDSLPGWFGKGLVIKRKRKQ